MTQLVHELIYDAAHRDPLAPALRYDGARIGYGALALMVEAAGGGLRALGARPHDRVALYLPKREEAVCALFGAAAAGCAFVALDPDCGAAQAGAMLRDSGARVLVSTSELLAGLEIELAQCPALRWVVVCGAPGIAPIGLEQVHWDDLLRAGAGGAHWRGIDDDLAALMYMQGGPAPAALLLSHRNLVAGARALQRCLRVTHHDRLLAALPLALDFGLHQLTTAFAAGAGAVLLNPLSASDVLRAVDEESITVLAAQPSLWNELAAGGLHDAGGALRVAVNASGTLAPEAVAALRHALPRTRIVLMYGQPEAFRATCLAAEDVERHGDSIGRALPQAALLVLRPDGARCEPGEPGELVQRGPLVAQGYWNDAARTRDSFRPLPPRAGVALRETGLWTGETVSADEDGYFYLARAGDEIIRTGGRRVNASEVEDVVYATGLAEEAVALGVAHPALGQVIAVLARARAGCALDSALVLAACRARLPEHMLPAMVDVRRAPLPRDRGGHIDRAFLAGELASLFGEVTP